MTKVGSLIRRRREIVGVSQNDLAKKLRIHGQYISNIERGTCVFPKQKIKAVALLLKIQPERIVSAMLDDYLTSLKKYYKYSYKPDTAKSG